jgi:hypothetical protein
MENVEVGVEQPLTIIDAEGHSRSIDRYGWVDIAPDLYQSHHLDYGNLAPAVGAALGVAYESPANLLDGKVVGCEHHRPRPGPAELGRVTVTVGGTAARTDSDPTLRLAVTRALERREVRTAPTPGDARTTGPVPPQDPSRQPAGRAAPQGRTRPVSAPIHPASAPGQPGDLSRFVTQAPQAGSAALPAPAHRPGRAATGGVTAGHRGSEWDDPHVDESDPIKMFSPETDAAHILGNRDGRFGIWHLLVALGLLAIALALAYLYL